MRLFSSTAPSIFAGGGLFIGGVVASLLLSCSSQPELLEISPESSALEEGPDSAAVAEVEDLGDVSFDSDPFAEDSDLALQETAVEAQEPVAEAVEQEPAKEFFFAEDPMDDPDVEVVGSERDSLENAKGDLGSGKRPESQLLELEVAPLQNYDEDLVKVSSQLSLAMLQARRVADELSRESRVVVPEGIRTFGELLPIAFETRNPFGDPVELIPPTTGLLLELDWTVTRWLPIGASDRVQRHRYFRLSQWFLLESDQTFREFTDIPLELNGDAGSVWVVEIDARIRCAGAVFGDKRLPIHSIEFAAARFLVLPPGWEQFQDDPIASLERVLKVPQGEVDRHVLVCVALLQGDDRYHGVELLLDGLRDAPNDRRRLTITQALQWLTGVQLGSLPEDWLKWAELRKLSAPQDGTDHEPTPGNPASQ